MRDRIYTVHTQRSGPVMTVLHPLTTPDGVRVSVSHLPARGGGAPDAVLLIHGLTTSSDMFVMPEHVSIASYLHDHGFDVWLADFRMSNHYAYNTQRTSTSEFEDIGSYDWPTIIGFIREQIGARRRLHVIAHCLGSVTFHYALYGKTIQGIDSVISNSVSLHARVHPWAAVKLLLAPFTVDHILRLPYLDPSWADKAADGSRQPWLGKLIARLVGLWHLECNVDACNLVSFTWGSGTPALFQHENMAAATHDRLPELFGPIAMPYFRVVQRAYWGGQDFGLQSKNPEHVATYPRRLCDRVGEVKVPTLFLSGEHNHIFPGSNRHTAAAIRDRGVDGYEYVEIPGYGHQDLFMGKHCDRETFPLMLQFLQRMGARTAT
jgi:pimeloyl-ACP methyl ester carboxylesterase